MNKFRLPRKIKKALKKAMWLYEPDENGSSLMAHPASSQQDYTALKEGLVKKFPRRNKEERKQFWIGLDKEVYVDDEILKTYVDNIFSKEFRNSSYSILLKAKNHPKAIIAYFNFINAYYLDKHGDNSYGNICCMSVDRAKRLLK